MGYSPQATVIEGYTLDARLQRPLLQYVEDTSAKFAGDPSAANSLVCDLSRGHRPRPPPQKCFECVWPH